MTNSPRQRLCLSRIALVICCAAVLPAADCQEPRETEEALPAVPAVRIPDAEVENCFRLSRNLYSGAVPRGDLAFSRLRKRGIRTILSVDGEPPDVEGARRQGLRYVHIPIGYDGVPRDKFLALCQAMRVLPGPVFVHCHHGKHRGPAAAGLCALSGEGWTIEQAKSWMHEAGTDRRYLGLYRAVTDFRPPTARELEEAPAELPESVAPPPIVGAMIEIDRTFRRLQAGYNQKFADNSRRADVPDAKETALILGEQLRELQRLKSEAPRDRDFDAALRLATRDAFDLEESLRLLEASLTDEIRDRALRAFQRVERACGACHAAHRDNEPGG
jgi:protein tyrosine phosphatase (PTP) superfamily phosphohydrolase (DUF442 family)